jgi:superfamily II DNA or RNA helicase
MTFKRAPLSVSHQELAAEWHPTRNGDLTPADVTPGSGRKVWWRCPRDPTHEWVAAVYSRKAGSGCPFCGHILPTPSTSLAALHPDLAAQWHPTRNETLTPDKVLPRSNKPVWWKCPDGPDHEWQAACSTRASGGGCPFCAGRRVSVTNSLAALFPDLAAEWHPTKNGDLTPDQVVARSNKKVWWRCGKHPAHEWQAPPSARTGRGTGCPCCVGRKASAANSLAALFPGIAAQWHPTKNGDLTPDTVTAGYHKKVWWKCPKEPDHEWQASVSQRTRSGSGCPCCAGKRASVTNSLLALFPSIAAEWHPDRNGGLTPNQVPAGSHKRYWWRCPETPDHEWQATVHDRTAVGRGTGCPYCAGKRASANNSLAALFPQVAAQWHPTRNGDLTPDRVVAGSQTLYWWKCPEAPDHEWQTSPSNRTRNASGCPCCARQKASVTNSLAASFPEVAAQWHPTKNGDLMPDQVVAGSERRVWWLCPVNRAHEWQASPGSRTQAGRPTGCPVCNKGWTLELIRSFVASLHHHLHSFTPAELYLLFQQHGLLSTYGKGKAFVNALATGRFPPEEVGKFLRSEPSLVDAFVQDPTQTLESLPAVSQPQGCADGPADPVVALVQEEPVGAEGALPLVEAREVLASLALPAVTSADEEAVEFLVASALAKLWRYAYRDEAAAAAQAEACQGEGYADRLRTQFLAEYRHARDLPVPAGYDFRVGGVPTPPNLMQRHFASRVQERRRVGNWSGTGAGKTLAAVLATRVCASRLTVVCCPNSVVDGWQRAIQEVFPDSSVAAKTFCPDWEGGAPGRAAGSHPPRYLVLNYEAFQQPDSAGRVRALVEQHPIDFVIVDEIHYAKQRVAEDMSRRRQLVAALAALAAERNPALRVVGMSATPVINNLQEGKSLVELVSGLAHDELDTRATVPNCMRLHQRLVTLGIRWMPEYALGYEEVEVEVDCGGLLPEIRALGARGSPLALEQVLTRARLPAIRRHVEPKTLIYTHYVQGIDRTLRDALAQDGWRVGFYTGEDKSGLDGFLAGDLDVLIGSSAIGTGVDGLQQVCGRLIVNVLPWTAAEFEQLKGRLYRQGQRRDKVTLVLPLTYADVGGTRWSWCQSKMQRLRFKKSVADAAVDGVVPEGHLRTPAQAYQDVMGWLDRLDAGRVEAVSRPRIMIPLPGDDPQAAERRRRYGVFSALNRRWNQATSGDTHRRLEADPEEWQQYHSLYREAREDWAVVPYEEMIRWCQKRSGYVIGDFGCGEAKLAEAVGDRHTVYSFDHVAVNEDVVACDMAHVPLDDEALDVAVFSLSLMGANFADYLREAYRTLKLDGQLHVLEATERFGDRDAFVKGLEGLGFAVVSVEDKWKFTHIRALKTERSPRGDLELRF